MAPYDRAVVRFSNRGGEKEMDCLFTLLFPFLFSFLTPLWIVTFQAAQLTHERFLSIDHSCKIFFDICQTELPYKLCLVLLTRGPWKFSLADIKKKFCRSDLHMVKNLSCVSCAS